MASDPDYVPPQGIASELTQLYPSLTQHAHAGEETVTSQPDPDVLPPSQTKRSSYTRIYDSGSDTEGAARTHTEYGLSESPEDFAPTQDPTTIHTSSDSDSQDESKDEGVAGSDDNSDFEVPISRRRDTILDEPRPDAFNPQEWVEDAMRIEVPDLLAWIAKNSDFAVKAVATNPRKVRLSLSSSKFVPEFDKPVPFVGLSTSVGLAEGFVSYAETFEAYKPKSQSEMLGKYTIPKEVVPYPLSSFRLADKVISPDPLASPTGNYPFLMAMKGNFVSVAREDDIKRYEAHARKALIVLSNADATVSALLRTYPEHTKPVQLFMKGLLRLQLAISAVTELSIAGLHQSVTLRRDTVLNAKVHNRFKPLPMKEDHLRALRNDPILGETELFTEDTLNKVAQERAVSKAEHVTNLALSRFSHGDNTKPAHKRPYATSSAAESVPPEKRQLMSPPLPKRPKVKAPHGGKGTEQQPPSRQAVPHKPNR